MLKWILCKKKKNEMDSILGFKYSKNVIFIASLFMGSLLSLTSSYAHEIDTSCLQFNIGHVSFKMIYVEVGESIRQSNIFISPSSYYIGQTEVTQELWEAVMGENPSLNKGNDLPVEMISWSDCQTFIARLNILTGKHFRLPTEAEWQYAAWGGNKSQGYKYSGNDSL
ncbi:MAG: SUMF1/EgtB/PvdO family nonheme iron enzyme, partial [Lachnospiraceae bacterium]|nr:SUMF1/EgtB/PvdO family nonheme iron enzyme [Lachnospiraceae bacterium]